MFLTGCTDDRSQDIMYNHEPPCCRCRPPSQHKSKKKIKKTHEPPQMCDVFTTYEPCVHLHFKTEHIDRDCLTHEQYLDMLATPKGYRWTGEVDCQNSELSTSRKRKKKPKRKESVAVRQEAGDFADEFTEDMWDVMSPDITDRLIEFLVNEFGVCLEKAEDFIDCKSAVGKTICKKKKSKALLSFGPKHKWVKELSGVFAKRIEQYIVNMLMTRRTPRTKMIAEKILGNLCDLTGEKTNLHQPKTKIQRTMVLIADRMALWIDDLIRDIEKPDKVRSIITEEEDLPESDKEAVLEEDKEKKEEPSKEEPPEDEEESPEKTEEEKEPEHKEEKEPEVDEEEESEEKDESAKTDEKEPEEREQEKTDESEEIDPDKKKEEQEQAEEIDKDKEPEQKEEREQEKADEPSETEPEKTEQPEEKEQDKTEESQERELDKEEEQEKTDVEQEKEPEKKEEQENAEVDTEKQPDDNEEESEKKEETKPEEEMEDVEAPEVEGTKTEEEEEEEEKIEKAEPKEKEEEITEEVKPEEEEIKVEEKPTEETPAEKEMDEDESKPTEEEEVLDEKPAKEEKPIKEVVSETEKVVITEEPEKKPYPDILDFVKADIASIPKDKRTDRQQAVKEVIDRKIEKIMAEKDIKEVLPKEDIDDAASRVAHWVEHVVEVATEPTKDVVPLKAPSGAYQIKATAVNSTIEVHKLSSSTVAQVTAQARGLEVHHQERKLPTSVSPINLDSAQEWADWATNIATIADEWGKWLDSTLTDAEKQIAGKKEYTSDRDWKQWRDQAHNEAMKWRVEKEKIKDEGKIWDTKLSEKLKYQPDQPERELKSIELVPQE